MFFLTGDYGRALVEGLETGRKANWDDIERGHKSTADAMQNYSNQLLLEQQTALQPGLMARAQTTSDRFVRHAPNMANWDQINWYRGQQDAFENYEDKSMQRGLNRYKLPAEMARVRQSTLEDLWNWGAQQRDRGVWDDQTFKAWGDYLTSQLLGSPPQGFNPQPQSDTWQSNISRALQGDPSKLDSFKYGTAGPPPAASEPTTTGPQPQAQPQAPVSQLQAPVNQGPTIPPDVYQGMRNNMLGPQSIGDQISQSYKPNPLDDVRRGAVLDSMLSGEMPPDEAIGQLNKLLLGSANNQPTTENQFKQLLYQAKHPNPGDPQIIAQGTAAYQQAKAMLSPDLLQQLAKYREELSPEQFSQELTQLVDSTAMAIQAANPNNNPWATYAGVEAALNEVASIDYVNSPIADYLGGSDYATKFPEYSSPPDYSNMNEYFDTNKQDERQTAYMINNLGYRDNIIKRDNLLTRVDNILKVYNNPEMINKASQDYDLMLRYLDSITNDLQLMKPLESSDKELLAKAFNPVNIADPKARDRDFANAFNSIVDKEVTYRKQLVNEHNSIVQGFLNDVFHDQKLTNHTLYQKAAKVGINLSPEEVELLFKAINLSRIKAANNKQVLEIPTITQSKNMTDTGRHFIYRYGLGFLFDDFNSMFPDYKKSSKKTTLPPPPTYSSIGEAIRPGGGQ
jgi:hypothetical protein